MASSKINRENTDFRYSACEKSVESSGEESENNSGCSHFYRQTAKIRFTRTTSKIQHRIEERTADEGTQQLFGCLRRSSSTNEVAQYLERCHSKKDEKATMPSRFSPENEKRRKELEKTRREVKRMDQLQIEQQHKDRHYCRENSRFTAPWSSNEPAHDFSLDSLPDSWIGQLPSRTASPEGQIPPRSLSSSPTSCCWDWCVNDQSFWPPHVDLEPFTGESKDWPFFIQRFKTWIHDAMPNDTLRMIYLEELLSPELRQKYSSYLSYPGRYRSLLVHLRIHYGHPSLVARSCFEALRQLTPLDSGNPKSTVGNLSTKVENMLSILRLGGCESEICTFSALELSGLVCKLSLDLRDEWNLNIKDRFSGKLPTLGDFAAWLQATASESNCWR